MNDFDDGEMLGIYIYEQTMLLEGLNDIVLGAEEEKHFSKEDLEEIFRIMHTVKGSAAMMEFDALSHTAHLAEDLFSLLQKNQPEEQSDIEKEIFNCVFSVLDYFQRVFEEIQSGSYEQETEEELNDRLLKLMMRLKGEEKAEDSKEQSDHGLVGNHRIRIWFNDCQLLSVHALVIQKKLLRLCEKSTFWPKKLEETEEICSLLINEGMVWAFETDEKDVEAFCENALQMLEGQLYVGRAERESDVPKKAESVAKEIAPVPEVTGIPAPKEVPAPKEASVPHETPKAKPSSKKAEVSGNEQRVHANQLAMISVSQTKVSALVDIVGEMINMLSNLEDIYEEADREAAGHVIGQMKKKSNEMREMTLSLNLITVEGLFQKVRKIVRDMCQKLGKEVSLILEGAETEIDKNTVEHLSNPFLHLIRNALDHGIEPASERKALGKDEHGTIRVEARNLGREVRFVVSDDGYGMDKDVILKKAKEKNLLTRPEEDYSDKEIYQLIMIPNFSTKETVSEYSGRGVGMNVVREDLEKINGSIQIESEKGKGTSFILTIPTSLSIVEGMDIRAGEFQFAMQSSYVKQIFSKTSQTPVIEKEGRMPEIIIKNRAYPLIHLGRKMQSSKESVSYDKGIMILVESSTEMFCVFVDEIIKIRQMVVKKLPMYLENKMSSLKLYCGYTVLGNGDISLILDTNHLL